ncbi:hypothetical protein D0B54_18030 [Solimonas sp. K1W22B-7]|uniref:hypothetical protein n=1 Tax=Solimonas sp. K1W22B-7 TaxID=2303331 RepID=UPI000E32E271|nr:hypothetical protein [Solimonas sp. K1W22B-7]AXQ30459.1 hypothetical protein D0B54_18030 [Solimonas sp. K1W22B-7]
MEVIKCWQCKAPMLSTHASCPSCGAPSNLVPAPAEDNESLLRKTALHLLAWWALILVLSRFSLSGGSLILLSIATSFYVLRLLKRWQ